MTILIYLLLPAKNKKQKSDLQNIKSQGNLNGIWGVMGSVPGKLHFSRVCRDLGRRLAWFCEDSIYRHPPTFKCDRLAHDRVYAQCHEYLKNSVQTQKWQERDPSLEPEEDVREGGVSPEETRDAVGFCLHRSASLPNS